ncbi:hypothetical protein Zm00014a_040563 [Zea mays]|uniref:GTD-binding domain-containing protein n=1 Tax=Zea mays TaxID=4577 RepID=A0A3L6DLN1_MAIZE|nr:hypothetical protein Zm00014a_040563 [Zea mays]
MILRLQQGKSEARMEVHQYRRYAEKRFAHDALDHRDAAVRSLVARLRACQVPSRLIGDVLASQVGKEQAISCVTCYYHQVSVSVGTMDEENDGYTKVSRQ